MSDILKNPVAVGVGGGVVGLLLGSLLSLSAIDSKVRTGVERAMGPVAEAAEGDKDVLAGLSDRLAALETAVTGTAGDAVAVTQEAMEGLGARLSALEGRIDGVAADLGARISETASEQVAALRGALDAQPAPEAAPEPAPTGTAHAPGETARFADGKLRVFVSDARADSARLAINGTATERVAVGESRSVTVDGQSCTVRVTGVRDGAVLLDGGCS